MNDRILVTGATGHVGSQVVAELLQAGVRPRALVRDRVGVPETWHDNWLVPDLAEGDFTDAASLDEAMHGVGRVFLASADGPDKVAHEYAVIDAARRAGVTRIVKLSALHAEVGSPLPAFDWHGRIEAYLTTSGIPHVLLRPAFFMENLLMVAPGVAATSSIAAPLAGARVAMVAIRDVAASTAAALTADDGLREVYDLTGPAAITFDEVAAAIGAAIGRPVGFDDLTPEQAQPRFDGAGHPEWLARQLSGVFALIRAGGFDRVADGVAALTGRPATTAAEWVRPYAPLFAGPVTSQAL